MRKPPLTIYKAHGHVKAMSYQCDNPSVTPLVMLEGWVILQRLEKNGARAGPWFIQWGEIFPIKRLAIAAAKKWELEQPLKIVRGSMIAKPHFTPEMRMKLIKELEAAGQ